MIRLHQKYTEAVIHIFIYRTTKVFRTQ